MPLYDYKCGSGHPTIVLVSMSGRKDTVPCEACGEVAELVVSLPGIGKVSGSHTPVKASAVRGAGYAEVTPGVFEKGSSIDADKVVDWRCTKCEHKGVAVDEPLPAACDACGSPVEVYTNEAAQWKDWFPVGGYFDRGLGVYFNSRAERSAFAKKNGLTEGSGVNEDTERALAIRGAEEKKVDDFWREECRQAAAAGERDAVPQWIKDEIGWKE